MNLGVSIEYEGIIFFVAVAYILDGVLFTSGD